MRTLFKWFRRLILYPLLIVIILFFGTLVITHLVTKPSNNRDWSLDQAILPSAEINKNVVDIHNIRNFTYRSKTDYTPAYYDKKFDVTTLKKAYYVVEPFSGFVGSAHTFVSFEFDHNQFLSISVEIRKEKGEKFSALKGLFNKYEMMYVIADERDVIKLRSNYRKDLVYVYPVEADTEKVKALFLDMINKTNDLKEHPEFYNTLTNTCTTALVGHINKITPKRVPWSLKVLFPSYSDKLAYDLGLISNALPFEATRAKYLINERALKYADDPDFSVKIRN